MTLTVNLSGRAHIVAVLNIDIGVWLVVHTSKVPPLSHMQETLERTHTYAMLNSRSDFV
jgi:hypothetical protein